MIDFSVCIETMFAEGDRSIADRVRAAADAGFSAVEIWDWRDKDAGQLRIALEQTGTSLHTVCVETWRDKCDLGDPGSHDEFVRRVEDTISFATDTGAQRLVVLAGDIVAGIPVQQQRLNAARALARAGEMAAGSGMTLLLEVVNRQFEGPDALIADSETALALIEAIDRDNVRFLYDRYHAVLNGEPLELLEDRIAVVGHVQAADVPGRHELGTGSVDWVAELQWLSDHGYRGLVGLETLPTRDSATSYLSATAFRPAT